MTLVPAAPPGPSPLDEPFEAVVARCEPLVRRTIRQVLGRHRDEDDLTQEVFLRLAIRLRQPGEVAVAAWVRRVARNVAIDELRRRRPDPVDDEVLLQAVPTGPDDAAVALEGAELGRIVHQAVRALPDRQRRALLQRLEGGAGVPGPLAVAGTLGPDGGPLGTDGDPLGAEARDSLVARARRHLRRELAERWRVAVVVPGLGAIRSLGGRIAGSGRRLGRWLPGGAAPIGAKVAALVVAGAVGTGAGTWLASAGPSGAGPVTSGPTAGRPAAPTTASGPGAATGTIADGAASVAAGAPSPPPSGGGVVPAAMGAVAARLGSGLGAGLGAATGTLGSATASLGATAAPVGQTGTGGDSLRSAARTVTGAAGTATFSLATVPPPPGPSGGTAGPSGGTAGGGHAVGALRGAIP